jgi:hypothetical protein
MPTYVFAIRPEKELFEKIIKIKSIARRIAGNQLYLDDEPHITIYVAMLKETGEWIGELKNALSGKLAKETFTVNGWHVFENDAITGFDTLVCEISGRKSLGDIQMTVVSELEGFRDKSIPERYLKTPTTLPKEFRKSIDKHGYPFVGDIWKPHISIASFEKKDLIKVWPSIKDLCPREQYCPDSLVIYELGANEKLNKVGEIGFK